MTEARAEQPRWDRRAGGVVVLLLLLFGCSVWNWFYNIPVQASVELPLRDEQYWVIDVAAPDEVVIANYEAGPVSFYNWRTGKHLFDRLSPQDVDIQIPAYDVQTAVVYRNDVHTVINLRTDVVRCQIPNLERACSFASFQEGRVLIAHLNGTAKAFDADTGALLWTRNDIHSIEPNLGGKGDLICAEVYVVQQQAGVGVRVKHCQVLRVSDGQRDERFASKFLSRYWITIPPIYLVEEDGGTVSVYALKSGAKLLKTESLRSLKTYRFTADRTELLAPYREGKFGCRLARWDVRTGKVVEPLKPTPRVIDDLFTDDGHYSVGHFMLEPPGYGVVRGVLAEFGLRLPRLERDTLLLVDNHAGKVVGRLEHQTSIQRIVYSPSCGAFFQKCNGRLAVYRVPPRPSWGRLVLSAAWMVISFVATVFKLRTLLVHMSQVDIIPVKARPKDVADRPE
ncbi:MAG TPA: hypothetical protein VM452_12105 [Caulifigura sp.]|nr:hypothetical protein [Caulifigura sp.]